MATTDHLSQLVMTLESSLPMYLVDSGVQTYPGGEDIRDAVSRLVDEQRAIVARSAAILEEREVAPPRHAYPLSFTALHDVDLGHLLPRLIADLRRQAEGCAAIAAAASKRDAAASSLAEEAAASARRHGESLERLARRMPAPLPAQA
ncbi:MAG TPA: hypothetical protein DC048_10515 [Planctomycetaceae bacterium]|nr:hypothetical protein [Planctomycetaceae bacterium]